MNITEQLQKLSNQPMEEQGLITKGWTDIKSNLAEYLEEKKIEKFMKKVNEIGPAALKNSRYADNKLVVLAVIDNEEQYVKDDFAKFNKENYPKYHTLDQETIKRIDGYGKSRHPESRYPESVMQYVSERLRDDLDVGRAATEKISGDETKYLSPRLLDDKALAIFSAWSYDGHFASSLESFSDRLKDDKETVLIFLQERGQNLKYASDRLKDDPEVVKASMREHDHDGLEFMSERLKDNTLFAKEILSVGDRQKIVEFSERLQQMVGDGNSVLILTKAVEAESRVKSLESKLAPKAEAPTRKIKI